MVSDGCAWKFVFFQAEDGIRDLVRSRGLGDVYKRQVPELRAPSRREERRYRPLEVARPSLEIRGACEEPVSYTHLTLPTIYSV